MGQVTKIMLPSYIFWSGHRMLQTFKDSFDLFKPFVLMEFNPLYRRRSLQAKLLQSNCFRLDKPQLWSK